MHFESRTRGCGRSLFSVEALEERRLFTSILTLETPTAITVISSTELEKTETKLKVSDLLKHEGLMQIDFQAGTGNLYGLSSTERIYQVNPTTGKATNVMSDGLPLNPLPTGTTFSLEVEPTNTNLVRIISDTGFHATYPIDANGLVGLGTQQTAPSYGVGDVSVGLTPKISGLGTVNDLSSNVTLFGLDQTQGSLVRFGSFGGNPVSPNTGLLTTAGTLGAPFTGRVSLDSITSPSTGADSFFIYNQLTKRDRPTLYSTTPTGGLTSLGQFGKKGRDYLDIAALPFGTPLVTTNNKNFQISDSFLPNVPFFTSPRITGLGHGEKIQFLTRRPLTNEIFGMTNTRETYTANLDTGVLTRLGQLDPTLFNRKSVFSGDFDPATDSLRMFTNFGDNFHMTVNGEVLSIDAPLNSSTIPGFQQDFPTVFTPAFSQNFPGASNSTLYAIDTRLNSLTMIGTAGNPDSVSTGTVINVLPIDFKIKATLGFEIRTDPTTHTDTSYVGFKIKGGSYWSRVDFGKLTFSDPLKFNSKFKITAMTTQQ
jgi:hypothetical protein